MIQRVHQEINRDSWYHARRSRVNATYYTSNYHLEQTHYQELATVQERTNYHDSYGDTPTRGGGINYVVWCEASLHCEHH